MSKNVSYLHCWNSNLCFQLDTEDNNVTDFNRFLVKNFPATRKLQQGGEFEDADREGFVHQLKERFVEKMEEGGSHETLYNHYCKLSQYLRWCDQNNTIAFTQESLQGYMSQLHVRVMQGRLKSSSYKEQHSAILVLFRDYLDLPVSYFSSVTVMDNNDTESYEAYTRSDLNQLLPFLRSLFKQTYSQFIESPDIHINAWKKKPTMAFQWKGQTYKLCSGITKMMCAGTYLLSYYTYANTSDLLQLPQPRNASISAGETWYTMPAFKRRAFKTIQVEMGDHELDIPKYAMRFFDHLLNASRLISTEENTTLLQTVAAQQAKPMRSSTLQGFLRIWVEKHFTFTDQTGRRLRPTISRFRETGAQITSYHQGEMVNDIMLGNTHNIRKRSYSKGNRIANNGMMQDAMSIREEEIKSGINTKDAQVNLGIDVLIIEVENKINLPDLSRTPNGASCATPFGEKSKKYTRKAIKQGLASKGEKLACADLLSCFGCPSQVIVQSLSDIWCLLSFKVRIEESLYLHLDVNHYRQNFEYIVTFIEEKIFPNIDKKLLKQAETKLDDEGYHPNWDNTDSVLVLIPSPSQELP
ncbi:phage integrase N-terminal SAM-like domain-containing protein [Vibrio lentus]|uniref:phage integrase N-terminal SAM-like domain-containing protein n=1 Tax=Vibrio lentus TaxID=136468 RepID=UPI001E33F651|nr:phage integrase N-terminal SAM-like domain-containing protein [Vibrio lentus]MCC4858834.1 phage integrase N-terminal SAM-like domain-containing protein [Vibrio lentus]